MKLKELIALTTHRTNLIVVAKDGGLLYRGTAYKFNDILGDMKVGKIAVDIHANEQINIICE